MSSSNQLQKFDQLKADVTLMVQPVLAVVISDDETSKNALASVKEVKGYLKRVEELRKELVAPLNEEVKRINAYAKQISEPLEKAEGHVKRELVKWESELARRRAEEFRKAEEARKKAEEEARAKLQAEKEAAEIAALFGDSIEAQKSEIVAEAEADRVVAEAQQEHKAKVTEIKDMRVKGTTKRWVFEVEDPTLVPRFYMSVDEKLIRAGIAQGIREIPGVRIFQETTVAIR